MRPQFSTKLGIFELYLAEIHMTRDRFNDLKARIEALRRYL
jgi:hypothetical protein